MTEVFLTTQAEKDLKKIPTKNRLKIYKKLLLLEENSTLGKKLCGELKGKYSLKIWPYRAVYFIKRNKEVWIIHILHRQQVYK